MINKGLLSIDELGKLAKSGEIETVVVGFTDHYGRLLGKPSMPKCSSRT